MDFCLECVGPCVGKREKLGLTIECVLGVLCRVKSRFNIALSAYLGLILKNRTAEASDVGAAALSYASASLNTGRDGEDVL